MLDSWIEYNGIKSSDIGDIVVKKEPNLDRPKRNYTAQKVEGRSGEVLDIDGTYENVTQTYTLMIGNGENTTTQLSDKAKEVTDWLYGADDYAELRDSYDTECFRQAYFVGPMSVQNDMNRYATVTANFRCRPERYYESGNEWQAAKVDNIDTAFANPGRYPAKPLIKIVSGGYTQPSMVFLWPRRNNLTTVDLSDFKLRKWLSVADTAIFQDTRTAGQATITTTERIIFDSTQPPTEALLIPVEIIPGLEYRIAFKVTGGSVYYSWRTYDENGDEIETLGGTQLIQEGTWTDTFLADNTKNAKYIGLVFGPGPSSAGVEISKIQMHRGIQEQEYEDPSWDYDGIVTVIGPRNAQGMNPQYTIHIEQIFGDVYLDFESQEAYIINEAIENLMAEDNKRFNLNAYVWFEGEEYPPWGETGPTRLDQYKVRGTGEAQNIYVKPRWWRL